MSEIVQAVREFLGAEEPPSQAEPEPEPSEYPKKGQSGNWRTGFSHRIRVLGQSGRE